MQNLLVLLLLSMVSCSPALKLSRVFAELSLISLCTLSPCYAEGLRFEGTVSLNEGAVVPQGDKVALYITAKADPGVWISAVRSIKLPPVLTKRISPVESFPLDFTISEDADVTPEGVATVNEWKSGNLPLLFSARLDADGVAATRSPDDLVGQGTSNFVDGKWERIAITLEGRGVTGKFITQPNK